MAGLPAGGLSRRRAQGLFIGQRRFSTAESVLVLLDEASRSSREIPEPIRHWLGPFRLEAE